MPRKLSEKQRESRKAYYQAHREKYKAYSSEYNKTHRDSRRANDRKFYEANKEKRKAAMLAYNEAHQDERKAYYTSYNLTYREKRIAYGKDYRATRQKGKGHRLTRPQKVAMAEQQGYCCVICGVHVENITRLHVDHCHKTGRVRGLLCSPCNTAIGLFHEDTIVLHKAIAYLESDN